MESPGWRKLWDACIFIGSFAPALLFGVAFANIFQGIPIDQKGVYQGTLFTLLNPYGLIGGALFVLLFLVHGALWLAAKTEGALQARAASAASKIWLAEAAVAVVFLAASYFTTKLYDNYLANPLLFTVILLTVAALFGTRFFLARKAFFKAWFASALTIVGATFYGVIGLFPNMFPSSLNPAWSLTAHNGLLNPAHPHGHANRGHHLRADRAGLSSLGVQPVQDQGDSGRPGVLEHVKLISLSSKGAAGMSMQTCRPTFFPPPQNLD